MTSIRPAAASATCALLLSGCAVGAEDTEAAPAETAGADSAPQMNEDGIAPADALSVIEDARASEDVSAFLSGLMACWYEHPGRHEPDCSEFISELPADVDGEKIVLSAPPEDGIHDGGADAEAGSTVSEVASDWSQNDEADVALTSF